MNTPSIIILAILGVALVVSIIAIIRNRNKGCGSCSGNCSYCSKNKKDK